MNKFIFSALAIMLLFSFQQNMYAQAVGCGTGRYEADNLYTVKKTNNIQYGSNVNVNGANQNLFLNFYEPDGDTASKRPLMIIAFGGSFISGDRNQVDAICQTYTKMGYCAAAIDYRYGFPFPFIVNQITTTLVVVRAAHDMKAAVRFFRKDAATTNTYKIDTDKIIVGGVSAGAITAIHAAYLNEESEVPSYLYNDTTGMGGIHGNSGNAGYSSAVAGVFSYSGTIGDSSWIAANDAPIVSFHETGDGTVPFDTREVRVSGASTGLIASGSRDIHVRCDNVGTVNLLYTYPTNNHTQYLASDPQVFQKTRNFMFDNVTCKEDISSAIVKKNMKEPEINLYPNPTTGVLNIESFVSADIPYSINIYDYSGKNVFSEKNLTGGKQQLLLNLSTGIYRVNIQHNDSQYSVFSKAILFE
jgi:para-nitrobenzyl esterase